MAAGAVCALLSWASGQLCVDAARRESCGPQLKKEKALSCRKDAWTQGMWEGCWQEHSKVGLGARLLLEPVVC